jgi:hypothetical protein
MHPFFEPVWSVERITLVTRSWAAKYLELSESDWCLVSVQGAGRSPSVALLVVDGSSFGAKSTYRWDRLPQARLGPSTYSNLSLPEPPS